MYKGYEIDTNMIPGMFTVFFEGDEVVFDSEAEAKEFIDSIAQEGKENEKG